LENEQFVYEYDNNGNLIQKTDKTTSEITTYTYDAENRLLMIENGNDITTYNYDGIGRRIVKNINGVITKYIYDNINIDGDIIFEFNINDDLTAKYTHSDKIDEPLVMEQNNDKFFYNYDGIGNIVGLTDNQGNIVQTYIYNSFDEIVGVSGSTNNPYTFTGRIFDSESSLYYYRARYYDPSIGRFINEDPVNLASIGLPRNVIPEEIGSVSPRTLITQPSLFQHPYIYVTNSPTNFTDPLGLWINFGFSTGCPCGTSPKLNAQQFVLCLNSKDLKREKVMACTLGILAPRIYKGTRKKKGQGTLNQALFVLGCGAVILDTIDCIVGSIECFETFGPIT